MAERTRAKMSSEPRPSRVVLVVDVWHPDLSDDEVCIRAECLSKLICWPRPCEMMRKSTP